MRKTGFSENLKRTRILAHKTTFDASNHLFSLGYDVSEEDISNWENSQGYPTPDEFLHLCVYYGVTNVLNEFGYVGERPNLICDEFNAYERFIESLGYRTSLYGDNYRILRKNKSAIVSVSQLQELARSSQEEITEHLDALFANG